MPSNIIRINNATEYVILDSQMDALMQYLDEHSCGVQSVAGKESDEIIEENNS